MKVERKAGKDKKKCEGKERKAKDKEGTGLTGNHAFQFPDLSSYVYKFKRYNWKVSVFFLYKYFKS